MSSTVSSTRHCLNVLDRMYILLSWLLCHVVSLLLTDVLIGCYAPKVIIIPVHCMCRYTVCPGLSFKSSFLTQKGLTFTNICWMLLPWLAALRGWVLLDLTVACCWACDILFHPGLRCAVGAWADHCNLFFSKQKKDRPNNDWNDGYNVPMGE